MRGGRISAQKVIWVEKQVVSKWVELVVLPELSAKAAADAGAE
jgi:hypothetical protein